MRRLNWNLINEEQTTGKIENENEFVLYAKINDFSKLVSLPFEDHEQWTLKFVKDENVFNQRVRKTIKDNITEYAQTLKQKKTNNFMSQQSNEVSMLITPDFFEVFKSASDNGMIKRRYILQKTINRKTFTLEIDLFRNGLKGIGVENTFYPYCKIDIEVDKEEDINLLNEVVWKDVLPEGFDEIILSSQQTPDNKKVIDGLYRDYFVYRK